jgi:hypothetical protein
VKYFIKPNPKAAYQWQAIEKALMLAEKFFLFLETLISRATAPTATHPDGGPRVKSQSRFVPINLPDPGGRY